MRRIIVFNLMTLDGFFQGINNDIGWFNVDAEFLDFANEQLSTVSTLLFGRKTYSMMEAFWTTDMAKQTNPVTTEYMNALPKIVVSKTLDKADWMNTILIKENIEKEILELKNMAEKDIIIFGSADLVSTLQKAGLIDEYRMMINPLLLGNGIPHFKKSNESIKLNLINSRVFGNGNILLYYQPEAS